MTAEESHRDKSTLKCKVPRNIYAILFALDVIQDEMSPLNFSACENTALMLITFDVSQFDKSPSKAKAPQNMDPILVTLDTTHLEMSPANIIAYPNTKL